MYRIALTSAGASGEAASGHDELGRERLHLVEDGDPGGALLRGGGIGGPDVLVAEDEDAADDGLLLCLPEVVAVGDRTVSAPQFEAMASKSMSAVEGPTLSTRRVGRLSPTGSQAFSLPS